MARKSTAAKVGAQPVGNSALDLAHLSVREINQLLHEVSEQLRLKPS